MQKRCIGKKKKKQHSNSREAKNQLSKNFPTTTTDSVGAIFQQRIWSLLPCIRENLIRGLNIQSRRAFIEITRRGIVYLHNAFPYSEILDTIYFGLQTYLFRTTLSVRFDWVYYSCSWARNVHILLPNPQPLQRILSNVKWIFWWKMISLRLH